MIKKIKQAIRYIFGEDENYSLEERLFITALIIGILLGLIGTITNYILVGSLLSIIAPFIGSLIIIVFYYFVRFKGMFTRLAIPIVISSYIALAFVWVFNGGMDGSNEVIFIVSFILGLMLVNERGKILIFVYFVVLKSILYFIYYYKPNLITDFPSAEARWLDVFSSSIYSAFIIYLIISFLHRNYTLERLKVEASKRELNELNMQLKESNETKDLFFSIISHDLKGPFNSIIGFSDLIMTNTETFDKQKISKYAEIVNNVANETYFLLENLLNWSRFQKGMLSVNLEKQNLFAILNQIISLYKELAKNKEIFILNKVNQEIYIHCDLEMTKTVLRNLLANAIKYTEPKGSILITAQELNEFIEIKVSDSGVGIAQEKLAELFTLKNNNTTIGTANEKGTGLGLHLCKLFIEKQGGKFLVESEQGKGSNFIFTVDKFVNQS